VVDGIIYTIGGSGLSLWGLPTVEAYDPATDTWTKKADMPTARYALSTSVVNGKIYAIGGARDNNWMELSTVEVYDPATDTWTAKIDMPTARVLLATSVLEGQIYAIGGGQNWNEYNGMSTVEAYDPITDNWASKAEMPTGRMVMSTSALDGRIYAIAGSPGAGESNGYQGTSTVEAYDPVTDTWVTEADIPNPRGRLSTSVVNGRIYAIGGSKFWYGNSIGEDYPTVEEYHPGGLLAPVSPQGKLTATWGGIKAQ
jgi:N-acetylneuraminic acid mutarotase